MVETGSKAMGMPKLYALSVYRKTPTEVQLVNTAHDFKKCPILRRKQLRQFIRLTGENLVGSAEPEWRIESARKAVFIGHVFGRNGFVAILVSDNQCPQFYAREITTKVLDEFLNESPCTDTISEVNYDEILPKYLAHYQQVDKRILQLMQAHYNVEQTKQIMRQNMEAAVEQHEKLTTTLEVKTGELNETAKQFAKVSKEVAKKNKRHYICCCSCLKCFGLVECRE